MLFFQLDFLLLFLLPLIAASALLMFLPRIGAALPLLAAAASVVFLYQHSRMSVAVALASLTMNYLAARYLLNHKTRGVFISIVAANLAVLGYFKYSILLDTTFFGGNLPFTWKLALPLGVSFYTFQQIAFLSDVYLGRVQSFNLRTYLVFKLFFPQFIAGPIVHFERVRASYDRWPTFNARSVKFGLTIFAIGMVKKMVGDMFAGMADQGFASQATLTGATAWMSMLAFTFQIYFDFSGYSDMAVGLARLFGVSLPFNFNSPYKAQSLSDFWRRWHITLSQWLRDYLYIPLGGNRYGALQTAAALLLTMALGGLWHGAGWNFLVWGLAHGAALVLVRFYGFSAPVAMKRAGVFAFVCLTWVLFRSPSMAGAMAHFQALLDVGDILRSTMPLNQIIAMVIAVLVCFFAPNSQQIALWLVARRVQNAMLLEHVALTAIIVLLSTAFITSDTVNAFIYFEF